MPRILPVLLFAILFFAPIVWAENPHATTDHAAMDHSTMDDGTTDHAAGMPSCHETPAEPEDDETPVELGALTVPDIELLDQDGIPRRFVSEVLAGRRVVMNFVFTTCTTVCPPMGATFGRLQQLLGDRLGDEVQLVSVSVDPAVDTPERLATWAERFGRRSGWTLLTGAKPEVDRLLKALQVFTPDKVDHAPTVLVGDPVSGRWERAYGLASPQQMIDLVDSLGNGAPEQLADNESTAQEMGQ